MSSQDNEGNESEHSDQLLLIVLPWAEVQKGSNEGVSQQWLALHSPRLGLILG